jgi:hypothetical protein
MDGVQGRGPPHDGGLRDGAETHQVLLALLHLRFDPVSQILSADLEVQPSYAQSNIECICVVDVRTNGVFDEPLGCDLGKEDADIAG